MPEVLVSFREEESKGAEQSYENIDMDQLNANDGNYQNDFNYAVNNTNGSIQENLFLQNRLGTDSIAQSDSLLIDGVMRGSFEKGSMIQSSQVQSLVGSLVI